MVTFVWQHAEGRVTKESVFGSSWFDGRKNGFKNHEGFFSSSDQVPRGKTFIGSQRDVKRRDMGKALEGIGEKQKGPAVGETLLPERGKG